MKVTLILIFAFSFIVKADSKAQNITLSVKNVTLEELFSEISKRTDYRFFYDEDLLKTAPRMTLVFKNKTIESVMDKVTAGLPLEYKIISGTVVINESKPKPSVPIVALPIQEGILISGKVQDINGEVLPGATISVKNNSSKSVTTDAEGVFALQVEEEDVLVVTFIGFETQEVPVNGRNQLLIVMEMAVGELNEVVVTGYSSQRRKDITGSVAVVDMENLTKSSPGSAQQALQGMASGVNVINSGVPGTSSKIFVRGVTSFGNTDPLVIVDGIEQNLNNINANDIESIQVLKDAGAAAIYGVRGANGVIVVTTKKGKVGAPVISYEGYYGMQYPLPGNPYDVLNSEDWMKVYNIAYPGGELFKNGMPDYTYRGPNGAGVGMEGDPAVDPSLYFYEPKNTGQNYIIQKVNKTGEDWFHNIFKRAPTMSHSINASGGTEKSKYLFGLGYVNQQGTMIETFEKRYTARVNTEFKIKNNIRVGENASVIYRQVPNLSGPMTAAFRMVPLVPLKDIAGNWAGTFGGPDLGVIGQPVAVQTRNTQKDLNSTWYIIGNAYAEVDFLKNFMARTSIGYNVSNSYSQNFTATETENIEKSTQDNALSVSSNYGSTMTWTNTLSYNNTFDKHGVNVLIGSEAIEYTGRGVTGESRRFFSEDFNYLVLDNGTTNISNGSSISSNSLFSLFGRVDYSYNDRYLLGATLRRDGSSRFGPDKRYGVFPSFSLGWRLSEENFLKDVIWLDDLKLRGSYGVLGSQNNVSGDNSFFLYASGLGSTYYDITGSSTSVVQGFAQSRIGNLATSWEENIVSNLGFDATLLNNKIDVSVEYYKKKIRGLLFSQPLPAVIIGDATAPTVNIGDIQNSGIDATLRYRGKINDDFHFSTGLNITSYKNEVVDIPDPGYFYSASQYGIGSIARNEEGHPVSSFYGYKIVGLFNSTEEVAAAPTQNGAAPGRFRYQDTDKDGAITAEDRVHLGHPNPDFTYGLNVGLDYKGFDLSGVFYGSQGNELFNSVKAYTHFMQAYKEQKSNALLKAWTPENTNTTVPKIETAGSFSTNQTSTDYYIEDGSYFRLKSLIVGYTVNPSLLQEVGISKIRIYAHASNVFTATKYSGLDPELGGSSSSFGIDYGGYPNNEFSLLFGLNISF